MSKKEEQRRIREQKQRQAQQRAGRQQLLTKIAMFVLAPLFVIAVVYVLLGQGEVYSPAEISATDHVRGNPDGVKMVVYADFQCPACANEHATVTEAWNRISSRTQLVFRHYPLSNTHPHAWEAATFAEAAGLQGKFWEMYDLLFINQNYWSSMSNVTAEFEGYAQQLDLDLEQIRQDVRSSEVAQKIRNDQLGGTRAGVRSTPTIFVDGRVIPTPRTAAELISVINAAAS